MMIYSKIIIFLSLTAFPSVLSICTDSSTFTFGYYQYLAVRVDRTCAWITANEGNTASRQDYWCERAYDGAIVQEQCPEACQSCTTPTEVPTKKPTATPTRLATKVPTARPSQPPSPAPSPFPTARPSSQPSGIPTNEPSISPTSNKPSTQPSGMPSKKPSLNPSSIPSRSNRPSHLNFPTDIPSLSIKPSTKTDNPTVSIKPSPAPSSSPTKSPTKAPTKSPTKTPTESCVDTVLRVRFEKDGKKISRYCSWVAARNTNLRCSYTGVTAACPVTCGACSTCVDPGLRFRLLLNDGRYVNRSCSWVQNKSTTFRCNLTSNICRSTCGIC